MARYYFSGVAGPSEASYLLAAGVERVLVDPIDLRNANGFGHVVLDCGAYRCFKQGRCVDAHAYRALAAAATVEWHLAPDVIGDASATQRHWKECRQDGMVPVWHFGSSRRLLQQYLDDSPLVAIGGLVTRMREKDETMLCELTRLCEQFPDRFHILGGNWLRAACRLNDLVASIDSAEWLVGGRYGFLVFRNTRTGLLQRAPARVLGFGHLTREERNVECARAINEFFSTPKQTPRNPHKTRPNPGCDQFGPSAP